MPFKAVLTCLVLAAAALPALADDQPVVVELFTSQGCSSCPPADEVLERLRHHDDVLPLSLHVDYWDYIGWKDSFADPGFTLRQKAYARAVGQRTIYTPQMVVGGVDHVVGHKPMQLMELIQKHKERESPVAISLAERPGGLRIEAEARAPLDTPVEVQLVSYMPERVVDITRGENAGRTILYSNIVSEWRVLGLWDGTAPLDVEGDAAGPVAVILQVPRGGPIVAAAQIDLP